MLYGHGDDFYNAKNEVKDKTFRLRMCGTELI